MRVRTLSKNMLLLAKATMLLVSCVTLLSVVRPANAQTAYTGNSNGRYDNGLMWTGYRLAGSGGYAAITPLAGGQYSGSWSGFSGNFTMGSGWSGNNSGLYFTSTVNANNISNVGYNIGSFTDNQSACVSVYGFVNAGGGYSLTEFYIVERYTTKYPIPGGTPVASNVQIGGASYNIYKVPKSGFVQFWSVRTSQAPLNTNTTVPVNAHFTKWASLGLKTSGDRKYMFLSTESLYQGGSTATGSVGATVWGW